MKKKYYVVFGLLAIILCITGFVLFNKGENEWIPGMYIRKSFGYLGYVDETVCFVVYYYIIGDIDDMITNSETTFYFDTNDGFSNSAALECSTVVLSTNNYIEKRAEFLIDLSDSIKEYRYLTLYNNSNSISIDIGSIVIEHRSYTKESQYNLDLQFGLIVDDNLDITIHNRNIDEVTIYSLNLSSDYLEAMNNITYILYENDSCYLTIHVKSDDLAASDIVYVKPIIEFQRIMDLEPIPTTIIISGVSMKNLSSNEVFLLSRNLQEETP